MASAHARNSAIGYRSFRLIWPIASSTLLAIGALVLLVPSSATAAQAPVGLGAAEQFAVLAGTGITNTGATTITGDVGSFPTTSQTGFASVTLNGTNHGGDAVTQQAKTDLTTAYNDASGRMPETAVATELGGTTLTPGVYASNTLGLTGTLTLDTLGDPNAVFIFKTNSTLITAANSNVVILNGSTACNVFWRVPSSATLGVNSHLVGTVLASTSIDLGTGATVNGRLLAGTGAVTLDNNTVTSQNCASTSTTTTATSAPPVATASPEDKKTNAVPVTATPGSGANAGQGGGGAQLAETGLSEDLALGAGAAVLTGTLLLALSGYLRRPVGVHSSTPLK